MRELSELRLLSELRAAHAEMPEGFELQLRAVDSTTGILFSTLRCVFVFDFVRNCFERNGPESVLQALQIRGAAER